SCSGRPVYVYTSCPVPAVVALGVLHGDRLALLAHRDRNGAGDVADERVVPLDAAVEDAHAHARAGRADDRPIPVNPLWERVLERDSRCRVARQRPRGEPFVVAHSTPAAARARRARSSSGPTARLISTRWAAARAAPAASRADASRSAPKPGS